MLKTLLVVIGLSVGFASFGQIKRDVKGRILDQRTEDPAEEGELT